MADNYLITGYWGEPHVTAENDRGIHAGIFGAGRFVLPVGEQFRAEYIGNNIIRMYDGKLIDNGAAAGIPAGRYIEMLIPEAGQGMKRNDLIVFQYSRDASTLIESGTFVLIQGSETTGTASDPALTQEDLLTDNASLDQFALWRIPVTGSAVSAPVQMFTVSKTIAEAAESGGSPEEGGGGSAPAEHTHSASDITAGTFAGQVVAKAGAQAPGTKLIRNSKLLDANTFDAVTDWSTHITNGEIAWRYE